MIISDFYLEQPQIVLGFHGCEKSVRDRILNTPTEHLKPSLNDYDWLGHGIYFWLNDPVRALEWAENSNKKEPAVIGAVIDLRHCLNLCERYPITQLQRAYERLTEELSKQNLQLASNKLPDDGGYTLLRYRDCAVIERLHKACIKNTGYDTVYGYFQEGKDAYPGAGIKEKTHIQICVRNTDCIKGYFLPRENRN